MRFNGLSFLVVVFASCATAPPPAPAGGGFVLGGGTQTSGTIDAGSGDAANSQCFNQCKKGDTKCSGNGVQFCQPSVSTSACPTWSDPLPCSAGTQCKDGHCKGCSKSSECAENDVCSYATKKCMFAGGAEFVISPDSGVVPTKKPDGSAWDPLGGAPDPVVVLYRNGKIVATSTEKPDTFEPSWSNSAEFLEFKWNVTDELVLCVLDKDYDEYDEIACVKVNSWLGIAKKEIISGPLAPGSSVSLTYFVWAK